MWLLSPLSWLLLAVAAGIPAWHVRSRFRAPWRGCVALGALSLSAMTPLVANRLLAFLEQVEPGDPACQIDAPMVAVILAGGIDQRPADAGDFSALGVASRRRLDRGLAYWRTHPGTTLVITGGPARDGFPAESRLLAAYATAFGVPNPAMRVETRSTNTWENAFSVSQMRPAVPRRIALVTSALHMPRARLAFEAAGFVVCPIPADLRYTPNDFPDALLPGSSALRKTEAAVHEFAGLVYYRLLARNVWRGAHDEQNYPSINGLHEQAD